MLEPAPMLFVCGMSRTGTTLLSTIFDSHSKVSMGYELIPPPMPSPDSILGALDRGLALAGGRFEECGPQLRAAGESKFGLFLSRCLRAGLDEKQTRRALEELAAEGLEEIVSFEDRLRVAWHLAKTRHQAEGSQLFGFKLNIPSYAKAFELFPGGHLVYILRDPRDVVVSHRQRNFDRSLEQICHAWNNYLTSFEAFQKDQPSRATLVRYEDLVSSPGAVLGSLFSRLPVELEQSSLEFHRSEATVHRGGHPNAANLKRDFFTTSIGKWVPHLNREDLQRIEASCEAGMARHGYTLSGDLDPGPQGERKAGAEAGTKKAHSAAEAFAFEPAVIQKHRNRLARRKSYRPADYEVLLAPFLDDSFDFLSLVDYVEQECLDDRRIILIRHDIDHDPETALRMARWEAARGIRSTYCLLHTAWYYGRWTGSRYVHSQLLIDCAQELVTLGHEVNFHNNLVALALREGVDPVRVLKEELAFFRSIGVPVVGTSTHGDALCRQLEFRNWELFSECCDDRFGGPRSLTLTEAGECHSLELGRLSMFDCGLKYEGYDIARDVYISDSGGTIHWNVRAPGRRPFGRHHPDRGRVAGILTHPIWWNFDREPGSADSGESR